MLQPADRPAAQPRPLRSRSMHACADAVGLPHALHGKMVITAQGTHVTEKDKKKGQLVLVADDQEEEKPGYEELVEKNTKLKKQLDSTRDINADLRKENNELRRQLQQQEIQVKAVAGVAAGLTTFTGMS